MKEDMRTLENVLLAMRRKIDAETEGFKAEPLAQEGETMLRSNPRVQEFRALVKDYVQLVKAYKEIAGDSAKTEVTNLSSLRDRLKVAK